MISACEPSPLPVYGSRQSVQRSSSQPLALSLQITVSSVCLCPLPFRNSRASCCCLQFDLSAHSFKPLFRPIHQVLVASLFANSIAHWGGGVPVAESSAGVPIASKHRAQDPKQAAALPSRLHYILPTAG